MTDWINDATLWYFDFQTWQNANQIRIINEIYWNNILERLEIIGYPTRTRTENIRIIYYGPKKNSNTKMIFELMDDFWSHFLLPFKKKTLKKTCMFFMCQIRSKRRFGGQRWFFYIFSVKFKELMEKVYEKYSVSPPNFHIDSFAYITCFLYWYI